jgi:uncharacterized damage-inducible protein DinB
MTAQKMFEHIETSRQRVLEAARSVSPEDFLRRKPGMYSIRDLLVHLMDAEDYWVGTVILGGKHGKFTPEKYEDVESLHADWKKMEGRTSELLARLSDKMLRETRTVRWEEEVTFEVDTALWYLFTHEIHHRGQICMLLRELGHEPPEVGLL